METKLKIGDNIIVLKNITQNDRITKKNSTGTITMIPTWRNDVVQCKMEDSSVVMLPKLAIQLN